MTSAHHENPISAIANVVMPVVSDTGSDTSTTEINRLLERAQDAYGHRAQHDAVSVAVTRAIDDRQVGGLVVAVGNRTCRRAAGPGPATTSYARRLWRAGVAHHASEAAWQRSEGRDPGDAAVMAQ
jgi:hypothetical protein